MNREFGEANEAEEIASIRIAEMTTKFAGVILRKAELEGSFEKVYSRVVEKMVEFEFLGSSERLLEIFGETGG